MGLEEIEKHILKEAVSEADKIKSESESAIIKIIDEARKQAEINQKKILKEAQSEAEQIKKSILVPARLAAKKEILIQKHTLLNQVFEGISEKKRERTESEIIKALF